MSDHKRDNRWMEQKPKGEQPTDDAVRKLVAQDADRFLAASQRARQALEDEVPEPAGGRGLVRLRWSLAGVAMVLCIIWFAQTWHMNSVPVFIATPAEAGYLYGIQGCVASSHDGDAICDVLVYQQPLDGSGPKRLIAVTDAAGNFNVAASAVPGPIQLTFEYEGVKPEKLIIDPDQDNSMGYERVFMELERNDTTRSAEVQLNPGQRTDVLPGVSLALDAGAPQPWSGSVVLDRNWPGFFANSICLDGLLRVVGPASEDLEVALEVASEKLDLYGADPEEIKVITRSQQYLDLQRADERASWRAASHAGWYDIADKYLLTLDQVANNVSYQVPRHEQTKSAVTISWQPAVGADYALLGPVPDDGRTVACWYDCFRGDTHRQYSTIKLIERTALATSLFEYRYFKPDEAGYFTDPNMLDRNSSDFSFDRSRFVRNHAESETGLAPLMKEGEFKNLPGEFQLARYDFVLNKPVEYPKLEADFSTPPGQYDVDVVRNEIGADSILTVTGDIRRLAKPPQWDFYGDCINDATGLSAGFRVTHSGDYHYKVILEEKCGNVIILEREMHFPADWAIGYWRQERDDPVVLGPSELPEASSLMAYTEYAVSSPAAYGVATGLQAGPWLCIDPPSEFEGVPLKELSMHIYARGVAGDYGEMPLRAQMFAVKKLPDPDEYGLLQFAGNADFSEFHRATSGVQLDSSRVGQEMFYLNEDIQNPEWDSTATDRFKWLAVKDEGKWNPYFKNVIGIDLNNLPPESLLISKTVSFASSPYVGYTTATDQISDLVTKAGLHEGVMKPDDCILIRIKMEDAGMPYAGQWELYSGGEYPSRVELETVDGRVFTTYFDYAPIVE